MPVKSPDVAPIVAIAVRLLIHEPPVVVLARVELLPWHTDELPVLGVRILTVSDAVDRQPAGVV